MSRIPHTQLAHIPYSWDSETRELTVHFTDLVFGAEIVLLGPHNYSIPPHYGYSQNMRFHMPVVHFEGEFHFNFPNLWYTSPVLFTPVSFLTTYTYGMVLMHMAGDLIAPNATHVFTAKSGIHYVTVGFDTYVQGNGNTSLSFTEELVGGIINLGEVDELGTAFNGEITMLNVDHVTVNFAHDVTVNGNSRDNDIIVNTDISVVNGNGGQDYIVMSGNFSEAYGGADDDIIYITGNHGFALGGGGDDILSARSSHSLLVGGPGDDIIAGHGGHSTLRGGSGNDEITSYMPGNSLEGGDDDDTFYAANFDSLDGGPGKDTLYFSDSDNISPTSHKISNIEVLIYDIGNEFVYMDLASLREITDNHNTLIIDGDEDVSWLMFHAEMTQAVSDMDGYNLYEGVDFTLYLAEGIEWVL